MLFRLAISELVHRLNSERILSVWGVISEGQGREPLVGVNRMKQLRVYSLRLMKVLVTGLYRQTKQSRGRYRVHQSQYDARLK